ncbi:GNAT family N-acetyltransferase [Granulosicoccus antarcticus]|uniref:N-acetyltransferase domain-containing protein n=1 Tax=Granulosicoccus antarcticus IMCC3135 TaxID=1192854 RepID=A0A2Z2P1H1_9GAMM|nr:GNAT family N-acetyltransferase [Granulosicoccus antarcticus]ASJ76655.1 hypothetical protein IMCC3135_33055 [Granulosicoccus antarcticus IMCC3135]
MTISNDQDLPSLKWEFHRFDSLDTRKLFALMKLRVDVFVVEQTCAYPELDGSDTAVQTVHLLGFAGNELAAYARAMPDGIHSSSHVSSRPEHSPEGASPLLPAIPIGRVVIASNFRGKGLARTLMQQMMSHLQDHYPDRDQCLAAQESVQKFYATLGFSAISDVYVEDGIPHIDMLRHL